MEFTFVVKFNKNPQYTSKKLMNRNPFTPKPDTHAEKTKEISLSSGALSSLHTMWVSVQNRGFSIIQPEEHEEKLSFFLL
jgi:hypothetical protein